MKEKTRFSKIALVVFVMLTAATSFAQQQFNITSSRENNYCNTTCTLLNIDELNGNPNAIIFVTPLEGNGAIKNSHPICAYYNGKQWSVMNTDNGGMSAGSQFRVQYYTGPDDDHFVHIVTKENLAKNGSYIDHAGLNGNPGAKFQFFQNVAPNVRGGLINAGEIKTQYDDGAGKWFITNSSGKILDISTGYNISVSAGTSVITNPGPVNTNPVNTSPFSPLAKIDNSGQRIFMTVVGKTQGSFIGENMTNRMEIMNLETEITIPRDIATGQSSGKRQHAPIAFQKAAGPSSIQFYKAIAANEVLDSVVFEVYKLAVRSNTYALEYKILLTHVSVYSFIQSFTEESKGLIDSVKIIPQKFEYSAGTMNTSDNLVVPN